MTFLHKLAKRLALVYPTGAFLSLLAAACGEGRTQEFLGPDPHKPNSSYIGLSITPRDVQLYQGDSVRFEARGWLSSGESVPAQVTWAATGGTISSTGWFRSEGLGTFQVGATATSNPSLRDSAQVMVRPPLGIMRLDITPTEAAPPAGTQQQFIAVALMGDGSTRLPTVTWSATGGTITSTGLFSADATPGAFSVTASLGDGAVVGRVEGNISDPVLVQLALDPLAVSLEQGDAHLFTARASWSDGSTTVPPLSWNATGGTASPDGLYTAGASAGSFKVMASNQMLKKADTANVNIRPRIVRIRVAPGSAVLAVGASLTMQATALRTDGIEGPVGVHWSAQAGSIQTNGTYTAGSAPGVYDVIADVHATGGQYFADTAEVQVGAVVALLQQLVLSPASASVQVGQAAQFSVAASWSDGSSVTPAVTWSATGGTVTSGGAYTAGTIPGLYRVIAAQPGGGKADTSAVTVTAIPAPVVTSFTVSPHRDTLQAGQSRQFSATLTWNDGQSHPTTISWLAAGGTITQSGAYTAGSLAGTFLVIATCSCGAVDTAAVVVASVSAPAPTLTSLSLTPATTTLVPGATKQFVVSGTWSDGASSAPAVQYIATGGTMSPSGLYTAGTTLGSYGVIAVQVGGTRADTSVITIQAQAPTLSQLVLNPSSVSVASGGTQQFVVSASWSDGSSTVPPVAYTATGGTVTADGLYTAGATAGTYSLIVTHQGGTKADTSSITIPAAVTLTQLVLNPSALTLVPGGTQQFVVTGSWSDGSGAAPAVTYAVAGGTITPGGLYTAGSATGIYKVIATHTGGTRADTSVVTIAVAPPPSGWTAAAPIPPAFLSTGYSAPTGTTINVAAGGDLQAALNSATCGSEIRLAAGATYTGNFSLPARQCSTNPIHVRTTGMLPPEGVRVTPASSAGFAKLVSPNSDAALKAVVTSRGWRIVGVEITVSGASSITYAIVATGAGSETTRASLPGNIVIDRSFIHGTASSNVQRCITVNGDSTAVIDSWVADCHGNGFDSQAIVGWNGPGPFKIVNNYLEGAGENVMFGGASPTISGVSPSDIEIRRNYFYKPLTWKASGAWTVKNLLELKHARRVLVEGNIFKNSWAHAQTGYALLMSSVDDGHTAPWSQTSDLRFRLNWFESAGNGVTVMSDYMPAPGMVAGPISRVLFQDNVFTDIGRPDLGGEGKLVLVLGMLSGVYDLHFDHNTLLHSTVAGAAKSSAVYMDGAVDVNLVFSNNLFTAGTYAVSGNGGYGTDGLNARATPWQFARNALADYLDSPSRMPSGTLFPSFAALGLDANLRLSPGSGLIGMGTDGVTVGANIDLLLQAIAGVAP